MSIGQTGSGKTYSMYGPPHAPRSLGRDSTGSTDGVIPRVIHDIFEMEQNKGIISFSVYCSFVQIYNENLFDMLRSVDRRRHRARGVN